MPVFLPWFCRITGAMTGEEFRKIRERLDLSQEELGKKLGVTRNTVSSYEHSAAVPPMAELAIRALLLKKNHRQGR
jgi:transcriptional regulator with XRE-family HTH domain